MNVLPLAFDYGLYQLLMAIRIGGTLVLERSFAFPAQTLKRIEEEQVTVFPGVPTVYATLVSMKTTPDVYPSVRRLTNTAAALPPSFHDVLHERFPNALIFRMYGLTECKRVSYLEPELVEREADVGRQGDPRHGGVRARRGRHARRAGRERDPARARPARDGRATGARPS